MRRKKKIDFFISYTKADLLWAKWVDSCLTRAGYSTYSQFADFGAGENVINQIHKALKVSDRVLGILSPSYLESRYAAVEWMAALHDDPLGEQRKLIFVRIAECHLAGVLPNISYIDLVGLPEKSAEEKLLIEILRTLRPSLDSKSLSDRWTHSVFPPRLPKVWHLPLLRKSLFIGREDVIAGLEESFSSDSPKVVALTGMAGTGKTSSAVEYCYREIDKYQVIWWIDASAERLIHQAIGQLAKELSLCDNPEDLTAPAVLELFERFGRENPSLLIFDNVLTPEIALRNVPHSPVFHVLVTSRNPLWLGTAQVIEVLPLKREASIDFLIARSGDNDRTAAAKLCEQLADLPIALEQAGRYIERTACGITRYSAKFEDRRRRAEKFDDESERAINAAWSLSMRRLLYENPFASTVLRALSYFGPHRIPREFLLPGSVPMPFLVRTILSVMLPPARFLALKFGDVEDLDKTFNPDIFDLQSTLDSLRKYGLIEMNPDDVCLHPLVRSVVRSNISPRLRRSIIRICIVVLNASQTKIVRVDDKSKLWCLHVLEIAQSAEEESVVHKDLAPILLRAAHLTAAASDEKKAIVTESLERALKCSTALPAGKRGDWDMVCLLQLAAYSRDNNEHTNAALYLTQAIDRLEEIKDPLSLLPLVMSEYAQLLLSEYDTYYASKFCEAAIALEQKNAQGSPMLVRLLAEYAEILRVAGEYDAAEASALEGLTLSETASDYFHVARLKFILGKVQSCKGDSENARRHLEGAFSTIERNFGTESPYLKNIGWELESLNNLEMRQEAARIFQSPREDEFHSSSAVVRSFSIRDGLVEAYELACEVAFEHLQSIAMPALVRAGLADTQGSDELALYATLEVSAASPSELGKVLSGLIVPIYNAMADDPLWAKGDELLGIFRQEILTQYSVSFRSRMFSYYVLENKNWQEAVKDSPSFEEYISMFESGIRNFHELVPECLINFEKDLLAGEVRDSRTGIHGFALRLDAGFYLNRFSEYAQLNGSL